MQGATQSFCEVYCDLNKSIMEKKNHTHFNLLRSMKNQLKNYLTPHLPCSDMGERKMPSPSTPSYLRQEGELTRVRRARELALPYISYSTQESRPCTLHGQYTRADPAVWCRRASPEGMRAGEMTLPTSYAPTAINQSGEGALHLAWAKQQSWSWRYE